MNIYFLILILLLFFSLLEFFEVSISNKVTFFICCFIIIFVSGFRYGLETDYWSYYDIFKGNKDTNNIEKGYLLYSDIVYTLTHNFNYFLVSIALVFLGFKCRIFNKYNYPFLVLLVYFLKFFVLLELNVVRQGIAITFILYAVYFLKKEKTLISLLFVLLATIFHVSSVFFLVVYPIRRVKWTIKKIMLCVFILVIVRLYILSFLINVLSPVMNRFSGGLIANGLKYIFSNTIPSSNILISIVRLLIPTICIFLLLQQNTEENIYFNIYFIGVWINIIFMGMDTIGYRLAIIFYSCEGFALSQGIKKNYKSLALVVIVLMLDIVSFISILRGSASALPYKNFWFIDPNIIVQ